MKKYAWIVAVVLLGAAPAAAEMWRYTDASGGINFTNDYSSIPQNLRGTAQKHVLKTNDEIADARRARIEAYTPEEARLAVQAGELTEDEVRHLVTQGSLRASELGDAYRFALTPTQAAEKKRAEQAAQAAAAPQDGMTVEQMKAMSGGQVGELKKFAAKIQASPNFRYSLYFEGALMLLMIVGLPFTLRNYRDDGTKRIIRASFFFSFLIISATGNILLFKNEITEAMNLGATLNSNPSPGNPSAMQPAHTVAP